MKRTQRPLCVCVCACCMACQVVKSRELAPSNLDDNLAGISQKLLLQPNFGQTPKCVAVVDFHENLIPQMLEILLSFVAAVDVDVLCTLTWVGRWLRISFLDEEALYELNTREQGTSYYLGCNRCVMQNQVNSHDSWNVVASWLGVSLSLSTYRDWKWLSQTTHR